MYKLLILAIIALLFTISFIPDVVGYQAIIAK